MCGIADMSYTPLPEHQQGYQGGYQQGGYQHPGAAAPPAPAGYQAPYYPPGAAPAPAVDPMTMMVRAHKILCPPEA